MPAIVPAHHGRLQRPRRSARWTAAPLLTLDFGHTARPVLDLAEFDPAA